MKSTTVNEPPLSGNWHHGNGVLVCGSLRIAVADFDNSPTELVKSEIFDWICTTLNAGKNPFEGERAVIRDFSKLPIVWEEYSQNNGHPALKTKVLSHEARLFCASDNDKWTVLVDGSGVRDVETEKSAKRIAESLIRSKLENACNTAYNISAYYKQLVSAGTTVTEKTVERQVRISEGCLIQFKWPFYVYDTKISCAWQRQ